MRNPRGAREQGAKRLRARRAVWVYSAVGLVVIGYGGEEFVVVLPDCDVDAATGVLERIRERLALALTAGRVPSFTVSFGLAASTDAATFDDVVAVADQALFAAKEAGRNRVVVAVGSAAPAA